MRTLPDIMTTVKKCVNSCTKRPNSFRPLLEVKQSNLKAKRWNVILSALVLFCGIASGFGADLKTLHGHVPEIVFSLTPKGRLPATNQLHLAIGVPLRDQAGLENFVAQVTDPNSPSFRQYLTREDLTARFGPTEQDYAAVKAFANSNGLSIDVTNPNRLVLDVTGPVSAVEKAFHITLHTYQHPTENRVFFAPDTEPVVDAALPVADIVGLSDYVRPHPHHVNHNVKAKASHATAKYGTAPDGSGNLFGDDFRNAYAPGVTETGAGQSIGLLEFDGYFASDINAYATQAGGGRTNIVIQSILLDHYNGTPSTGLTGGEGEVELDIEMSMAMAPGLSKIVCFSGGPNGNQNDILNSMLAHSNILNLCCCWSWGGPSQTTDAIFLSMDAVGQSFFNATGDSQAFTTGSNSVNGVDNPNAANAPSSNPYITQVGGTTLTMNGAGQSWSGEVVWNWAEAIGQLGVGSSGGISSYYTLPTWQATVGNVNLTAAGGSIKYRNIPDVAANADNVYEIYNNNDPAGLDNNGGTSAAAPLWAGFAALVNQQLASQGLKPVGFMNPALYSLAANANNYSADFHDITSGDNTWSSSPNQFFARSGYDLCTGLGAMDGNNLLAALDAMEVPASPAPFFTGQVYLTNNWYWLAANSNNVFGYYSLASYPYVFHLDLGWEYFFNGGANDSAYFYDFTDKAFFYTQAGLFPYLYDFKAGAWVYYLPQSAENGRYTTSPRWFYNYSTQQWTNSL